jgi:hypothetical protein
MTFDNSFFLFTDGASYTKRAAEESSVRYRKLLHVSCVVYARHKACETIHVLYKNVDKLMANEKEMYVKPPTSTEFFKKKAPEAQPPPPFPISRN